jgi:hypothetical protein
MKIISKLKALFTKDNNEAIVIERKDFADEMKEKFKGNIALLKAIEENLNRKVKKHEFVSLTD